MKKYLILLTIFLFSIQVFSQKHIGLLAGYSLSNRSVKDISDLIAPLLPSDFKTLSSFYIGGNLDFSLSNHVSLSPELFYARRGSKLYYSQFQGNITSVYNDIVSPILLRFGILKKIQLYIGPEFSYVISNNWKGTTTAGGISGNSSSNKYQRIFDISVSVGGSFEFIRNLFIDLRYNRGLLDQAKTYNIPGEFIGSSYTGQQIPVDYVARNWSLQVGLKYNMINKTKENILKE